MSTFSVHDDGSEASCDGGAQEPSALAGDAG